MNRINTLIFQLLLVGKGNKYSKLFLINKFLLLDLNASFVMEHNRC
jgi:hypothetical protein